MYKIYLWRYDMNIIEKYGEKTINELGKLFFEIGNKQLVPELSKQDLYALKVQELIVYFLSRKKVSPIH